MTVDNRLEGVFTALVTPFAKDGSLDRTAYQKLAERQIEAGISGLVPCGTTGETPTLDASEWEWCIRTAVEVSSGRVPVIAGTGTNSTRASVEKTQRAKQLGADAALVVTPYYNKPNPRGLKAHYAAVASDGGLPVVVYNVPPRTGLNMTPEQVLDIAMLDNIAAVKEAAGSMSQALTLISRRPDHLSVLSGEDDLTCAMVLMGGQGVISVVSNVDPAGFVGMVRSALAGDAVKARAEHERLLPLIHALFCETNPVPAKAALSTLGLCEVHVRPPLAAASAATMDRIGQALHTAGVTSGASR